MNIAAAVQIKTTRLCGTPVAIAEEAPLCDRAYALFRGAVNAKGCAICVIWNDTKINLAMNYYMSRIKVVLEM